MAQEIIIIFIIKNGRLKKIKFMIITIIYGVEMFQTSIASKGARIRKHAKVK